MVIPCERPLRPTPFRPAFPTNNCVSLGCFRQVFTQIQRRSCRAKLFIDENGFLRRAQPVSPMFDQFWRENHAIQYAQVKRDQFAIHDDDEFSIAPRFQNMARGRVDECRSDQVRRQHDFPKWRRSHCIASFRSFSISSRVRPRLATAAWLDSKRKLNPPFER